MKNKKILLILITIGICSIFSTPALAADTFTYTLLEQFPGFFNSGSSPSFPDLVSALYSFGIWTVGIAAFLMLVIGGFMYITSAGNTSSAGTARKIITDALLGLTAALAAYLILYVVNPDLVNLNLNLIKVGINSGGGSYGGGGASGESGGSGSGNGKCEPVPSGPCSEASLASSFGNNAKRVSMICNVESNGNAAKASLSDRCKNDPQKRAFSWGLFQINLTVHKIGGLDCPSAFEGKNYNCRIKNESLYAQCVTAAKNPQLNIKKAIELSNGGSKLGAWKNSKNKCGL